MAFNTALMPNLVFSSGGSNTNADTQLDDAYGLSLISPATAPGGTVTIQVEQTSTGASFVNLQSGGVDVTLAGNRGIVLTPFPFRQIRLTLSVAATDAFTYTLAKIFPV